MSEIVLANPIAVVLYLGGWSMILWVGRGIYGWWTLKALMGWTIIAWLMAQAAWVLM